MINGAGGGFCEISLLPSPILPKNGSSLIGIEPTGKLLHYFYSVALYQGHENFDCR